MKMKLFSQRSRVCALMIVLGLTIASCVMRGGNPKLGFPDSRSLTATEPDAATKAVVQTAYGKLPLSFEANHGQSDGQVKFLSRGSGYNLFLTPTEAVIALQPPSGKRESEKKEIREREKEERGNPQSIICNQLWCVCNWWAQTRTQRSPVWTNYRDGSTTWVPRIRRSGAHTSSHMPR